MAASSVIGLLRVLLTANTAEFDSAMRDSSRTAKAWTKDLKQVGQQATQIGSALTKSLTLPIIGLGIGVSKLAMDFESSFAGVRKTVQATEPEFAAMAQSFRDLSKQIPVNVNELNRLGEAAGALGIPKAEIVDFARVMALLGVTTNVTSDQAAESIAKIQNIFAAAGKETDRFAATLVALGASGASTETQILEMATRIAGAGNAIGISQGEVLAFASALSGVGIEAEMGGSAISRVFIEIASAVSEGGDAVKGFAQVSGTSIEEFSKLFKEDAASAVNEFISGLGKVKTSGGDLIGTLEELGFSEIRVRDTLLRAAGAGNLLTDALNLQKTAWQQNTALTAEAAERFKTTESQLTLLWNRIKDVGVTLGNALLPMVTATVNALTLALPLIEAIAKGFAAMPVPIQAVAVGFGLVLAAAGPVLLLFGQMALGASALTGAFAANGVAARAMATGLGILRGALAAILGPIGLVGAAAIAATAALTGFIEKRAQAKVDAQTMAAQEDSIALAISRGANALINYTEAIQFNDEWVAKRNGTLKKSETATKKVDDTTRALTKTTKVNTDETKKAERASKDHAHAMDLAAAAGVKLKKESDAAVKGLAEMEREMLRLGAAGAFWATRGQPGNILALNQTLDEAIDQIQLMRGIIQMPVGGGIVDFFGSITVPKGLGGVISAQLKDVFSGIPQLLTQAMTGGGGIMGALKAIGVQLADALTRPILASMTTLQKAAVMAGVAGAAAIGGAAAGGMGSQVATIAATLGGAAIKASAWGAAMTGAGVAGSIALGAATLGIGAAAVGVALLIKKLGSGRDAVKKFAESFGGFDALQARLQSLGDEGEKLWRSLGDVGRNNAKQAQETITNVVTRMAELEKAQATFNTTLQTSLARVKEFGGTLPESLRGYLTELQTAGRLTQENIDLLAELAGGGTVSWEALEAAAGRYGVATDKLGQGFNEAKIHEAWQQIIDDIDLFARGNVDVNALLSDMSDEISKLVQDSKKFGTEIPENMRPWIEKLIASGQLLDENGEKITDIGKLTFGATLQTSLEKLTKTIKDLIDTLNGVKPAIDDIPKDVEVNVTVREKHTREGDFGDPDAMGKMVPDATPEPSFARGSNGWRNFGAGTPAVLHGIEAVVRPGDTLAGVNTSAKSPTTVYLNVDQSGAYIDSERTSDRMVAAMFNKIRNGGGTLSEFSSLVKMAAGARA